MPEWSIEIVPSDSGTGAKFDPAVQNAQQDDLVTWNNTTQDTHQPWPADSSYNPLPDSQVLPRGSANYMSDPIPAGESSRPSYDTANIGTTYYCCLTHPTEPSERGTIIVTAVPT